MFDFLGKLVGGALGFMGAQQQNETQQQIAAQNIALQREFATTGIQWKVRDAKKAGIHPLYALGANTTSFSPVSVGTVNEMAPLADAARGMGQDLARAANAYTSPTQKANQVSAVAAGQELTANNLRLENMQLQNQLLRSRLALVNQPGTPPGVDFPVPENKKVEERPPLMLWGKRWDTYPGTSPMKAWQDQYGDEGPVSWALPVLHAATDTGYNWNNAPVRALMEMHRRLTEYGYNKYREYGWQPQARGRR